MFNVQAMKQLLHLFLILHIAQFTEIHQTNKTFKTLKHTKKEILSMIYICMLEKAHTLIKLDSLYK